MDSNRYSKMGFSEHGCKSIDFLFAQKDILKAMSKLGKIYGGNGDQGISDISRGQVQRSPARRGLG